MSKAIRRVLLAVLAVSVVVGLSACAENTATSSAMCAFVIGDGSDGHDAKVHHVYYPGQIFTEGTYEDTKYFPCNPRTYSVGTSNGTNANGHAITDRPQAAIGYTSTHTAVKVSLTGYWTLNQNRSVLTNEFYPICLKYKCATGSGDSGDANFSTPGWNGWLGENVGPSMDAVVRDVVANYGDEIWSNHDTKQWEKIGNDLSAKFASWAQKTTGSTDDLFCGSGTSHWDNPDRPGSGNFTCSKVRFVVNDVEPVDADLIKQAAKVNGKDAQVKANQDALEIAKAKYGSDATFWLGVQDSLGACAQGSTCVVNVGGQQLTVAGK